ncbi:MAG: MaoC family dehydratase N-terminal domain-containing protein [Dehalococcoidia bacterium]|nr:MaoC family dehydratase N-terminal domain-containing protein [Dehalococcoidia bacterium]
MATISYGELAPGYEFPVTTHEMSSSFISSYVKAVESPDDKYAPPLAIAACAMNAMTGAVSFPPGIIHASQEFEFFRLVPIGTTIICHARVIRKLARSTMHMLELELSVFNKNGERIQSGKATLILPVQRANAQ